MKISYFVKRKLVDIKNNNNLNKDQVINIYKNSLDRQFRSYVTNKANSHPHEVVKLHNNALDMTSRVVSLYKLK